jgi:hypothetical protein
LHKPPIASFLFAGDGFDLDIKKFTQPQLYNELGRINYDKHYHVVSKIRMRKFQNFMNFKTYYVVLKFIKFWNFQIWLSTNYIENGMAL